MEFRQIGSPPPDLELGFPRQRLKYVTVAPRAGIGPNTGVMLFICPWGMRIEDEYVAQKLLPYLADTHDCLAVAANYFGIGVKCSAGVHFGEFPGWRAELARRYGAVLLTLPTDAVVGELAQLGVTVLPPDLPLLMHTYPEYQSFGLQPALDNIAVLAEVLRDHPVRRDRIYGFGSSYGGYIACMMLKFMPNTFHAVVENSGFAQAMTSEMASLESERRSWFEGRGGIRLCCVPSSPWTLRDPGSKYYIGAAVREIRDCTIPGHFAPSKTHLASYHAEKDDMIPIDDKRRFWAAVGDRASLRSVTIDEGMIDGRLFKVNAHGMDASLRRLSDEGFRGIPAAADHAATDFERRTIVEIPAGDRRYRAIYQDDLTVEFSIEPAA